MFDNFFKNKVLFIQRSDDPESNPELITLEYLETLLERNSPSHSNLIFHQVDTRLKSIAEMFSLLQSKKSFVLCNESHLELSREILERTDLSQLKDQTLIGFFTSATTGNPRVVFHDITQFLSRYKTTKNPIRSICFYKPDHIAFVDVLLSTISCGGLIVFQNHFNALKAIEDIEHFKVTHLFASPSFLSLICHSIVDWNQLSSLKQISFGSELMPDNLLDVFAVSLPDVKLKNVYATTQALKRKPEFDPSNPSYYKFGKEGIDYQIMDGELKLRKPDSLRFVIKNFEVVEANEWINTGDIVEVNTNGYYKLIGRNFDFINVGGEKILPKTIEDILLKLEAINDVKVYGEKNELMGEIVCADIVKKHPIEDEILKQEIREIVKQKLMPQAMPIKINFVNEIKLSERLKR